MTRTHTPQAGDAVEHPLTLLGGEVHAVGTHQNPRRLAKVTVGREGQPQMIAKGRWVLHEGLPECASLGLQVPASFRAF
jgi:hypothetical protein